MVMISWRHMHSGRAQSEEYRTQYREQEFVRFKARGRIVIRHEQPISMKNEHQKFTRHANCNMDIVLEEHTNNKYKLNQWLRIRTTWLNDVYDQWKFQMHMLPDSGAISMFDKKIVRNRSHSKQRTSNRNGEEWRIDDSQSRAMSTRTCKPIIYTALWTGNSPKNNSLERMVWHTLVKYISRTQDSHIAQL